MANNDRELPKLDLEKFIFSPPGPMGWSMSEYESMMEKPHQEELVESPEEDELEESALIQLPAADSGELNEQTSIVVDDLIEDEEKAEKDNEVMDEEEDQVDTELADESVEDELILEEEDETKDTEDDDDWIIVPNELMAGPWRPTNAQK